MRNLHNPILVVEDDEEPIAVIDDNAADTTAPGDNKQHERPSDDDAEIEIEDPSPDDTGAEQNTAILPQQQPSQESAKHALAARLYKAIETAYGSVYELTDVLNEIGRRYKAPALKALGNNSVSLQASIEGMPGLLDGKHEKEDIIRFMGLMDEITND